MKYEGMPRPAAKAKEPSLDTGRDQNRINRVRKTYDELIKQDERFRETLDYSEQHMDKFISDLRARKISHVFLIGCGDSWFVGMSLEILISKLLDCHCKSYDAFEFLKWHSESVDENTIVIGQSASGATASVLKAMEKAREKNAYAIGISNTAGTAILENFDFGLLIQAKREGWPTQATTSAIGAIAFIFANLALTRHMNVEFAEELLNELKCIPEKIADAIKFTEDTIKNSASLFLDTIYFQTTGSGAMIGAANVACAKLRELCPVHASAYPIEEFHHYRTLKPKDPLLIFLSGGNTEEKEIDTALVGAYDEGIIVSIGSEIPAEIRKVSDVAIAVPKTMEELQVIISMIPAHLFAYYVAIAKYTEGVGYPSEA